MMLEQSLPAPLTHPDCDLRDFPYMPLMVVQFRDSDLAADETPEVCWAAMLIQAASWHQLPAGSIPDDDNWLAKTANYRMRGKTDRAWKQVRQGALHGWMKCNDGRLYHPDVAKKANDAWDSKLKQRYRSECARLAKQDLPRPKYDEWVQSGCPCGDDGAKLLNPQGFQAVTPKDAPKTAIVTPKDASETAIVPPKDALETFPEPPLDVQVEVEVEVEEKETATAYVSRSLANAPPAQFPPPLDEALPDCLATGHAQDLPQDALDTALAAPEEPVSLEKPAVKPDAKPIVKPDKRGSRLPDDWQLPKSWGEWALQKRPDLTVDDVRNQAERFADYWHAKAGVNARKADWEATWRNWIRDAKTARQAAYARSPPTRRDCYAEQSRRISEMAAQADAVILAQMHQRPVEIDMGVIHASPAT